MPFRTWPSTGRPPARARRSAPVCASPISGPRRGGAFARLDPDQEGGAAIALPPDAELAADLAAPRWSVSARGILVEQKEEIRKRIGRSPGKGDAVVMAFSEGGRAVMRIGGRGGAAPKVRLGYAAMKGRKRG